VSHDEQKEARARDEVLLFSNKTDSPTILCAQNIYIHTSGFVFVFVLAKPVAFSFDDAQRSRQRTTHAHLSLEKAELSLT
jgi:hypothetical protein